MSKKDENPDTEDRNQKRNELIDKKLKVNYNFNGLTEALETDLKELVSKNLYGKMDRYLEKILQKEDAEGILDINLSKDKKGNYEGSFRLNLDGNHYIYKNPMPFKNPRDVVGHAFDHFKEELSDKK